MEPKSGNSKFAKRQTSLNFVLARAFVLLAFGTVLLVGLIAYFQPRSTLEKEIMARLESNAQSTALFMDEWVRERKQEIETLAGVARIRSLDPTTAREAIHQYYKQWGNYETLFVTGADGKTIATSDDSRVLKNK